MFIITCSTPVELRSEFVKWLELMSARSREQVSLEHTKRGERDCLIRANTYTSAADFIRNIVIQSGDTPNTEIG